MMAKFDAVRDYGREHLGWNPPKAGYFVQVETLTGEWVNVGWTHTKKNAKQMAGDLNLSVGFHPEDKARWARIRKVPS